MGVVVRALGLWFMCDSLRLFFGAVQVAIMEKQYSQDVSSRAGYRSAISDYMGPSIVYAAVGFALILYADTVVRFLYRGSRPSEEEYEPGLDLEN